jgi:single-stranded-DNA-specific exonuclease
MEGAHLKMKVGDGGTVFDAIAFKFGFMAERLTRGDKLDIAYTFEENEWNGERKYQLNIKDIKYADK